MLNNQTTSAKHLFNLADYYHLAQAGVFAEDVKLELINGEIFNMAPIGSRHASVVSFLAQSLAKQLTEQALIRVQDPLHLGDLSAPQPDLAIVKPRADFYRDKHPSAEDVLLLIEVADTTTHYDMHIKLPLYAQFGISECWLVDLNKNCICQFHQPLAGKYTEQNNYPPDAVIFTQHLAQLHVKLAAILS